MPIRQKPAKATRPRKKPAAPKASAARTAEPKEDARAKERALLMAQAALAKKAEDVLLLDVRGLTSYAEYFVLMSAGSSRQAGAIAESIEKELKQRGTYALGSEGQKQGNWVLLDYGDVVAHIFAAEVRAFYDLEGLWADAPRQRIEG